MSVEYSQFAHHSRLEGYQNVILAKQLARFVVRTISKKYGKNARVAIYGIDGSSIYLAAFCKMLRPDWNFISGDSTGLKSCADFNEIKIFVDDYLSTGSRTKRITYLVDGDISEYFYFRGNRYWKEKVDDVLHSKINFLYKD